MPHVFTVSSMIKASADSYDIQEINRTLFSELQTLQNHLRLSSASPAVIAWQSMHGSTMLVEEIHFDLFVSTMHVSIGGWLQWIAPFFIQWEGKVLFRHYGGLDFKDDDALSLHNTSNHYSWRTRILRLKILCLYG